MAGSSVQTELEEQSTSKLSAQALSFFCTRSWHLAPGSGSCCSAT